MRIIIMRSMDVLTYNKSFVFSSSDRLEENIQKCIITVSVTKESPILKFFLQ